MITRKIVVAIVLGLTILSVTAFVFNSGAGPAERKSAFELQIWFDGSEVTARPSRGVVREVAFTLSAENPGPVFLSEAGVIARSESATAEVYCFSVSLVDDELVFESVRGTNWTELSYSCGGAVPCSFIVSERGVRGL